MDVGGEVKLGSMLFTLVEPHAGHEVAYNRWYERDHFYAGCMVGPWLFAGRRWVATAPLKDLRTGTRTDLFGDARLGSYLAVYWVLEGKHDDHFAWALEQVQWLHANGRMFGERDHIHTLLYDYTDIARRDGDGVPPELALDHPYAGLVAVIVERGTPLPPLGGGSPIDLALAFDPIPLPEDAPVTQPGMDGLDQRQMQLWFLDRDPAEAWPRLASDLRNGVLWAAPFIPTVPGTDRYADQL